jgi:hypothetical protein
MDHSYQKCTISVLTLFFCRAFHHGYGGPEGLHACLQILVQRVQLLRHATHLPPHGGDLVVEPVSSNVLTINIIEKEILEHDAIIRNYVLVYAVKLTR